MTDGVTERQVPFFCPYCGEETLRPAGPDAGAWECDACARGFELRFVAVRRPSLPGSESGSESRRPESRGPESWHSESAGPPLGATT